MKGKRIWPFEFECGDIKIGLDILALNSYKYFPKLCILRECVNNVGRLNGGETYPYWIFGVSKWQMDEWWIVKGMLFGVLADTK